MSRFSSWFRTGGRISSGAKRSSGVKLPPGVRRLFRLPGTRARILRDLDEEMRIHFAMRIEELRSLGMSEADAEAEALRRFGDPAEYHDYAERRATRRAHWLRVTDWLTEWTQDVRFATRQFRKSPGFTAIAVLTLALGIGANTAIFSVVHHLLLAPLPYPDGNRIVKLVLTNGDFSQGPDRPTLQAWHARAHSFDMIAAVSVQSIMIESREEQDSVHAFITSNFLQLLGLHPTLGRGFTPEEERPGGAAVAIIGYGLWQRSYGGRADALGSTVHVGGRPYTIVGVAPRDMAIPMSYPEGLRMRLREALPGIWLPASLDSLGGADVFARLRPGVSAEQATRELHAIAESVPGYGRYKTQARAMRAQDFLDPREARTVEVLFVAVGVLLLIACANIANLLLSRSWARRREFAVRAALGAGRARLARQMLTESVLLALAGGILGVGVAWQTVKLIVALRPPALENLAGIHIESTVLLWSAGISVLTGVLFGCAPALFAGARSVGDVLRSETRGASGGGASRRMRSALIVLEIAMSLVLLIGAGLLVRSFVALQQIPLGFDPHGLVTLDVMLPRPSRQGLPAERRRALRAALLERLRAVPGVMDAAVGTLPGDAYGGIDSLVTEPDANGYSRSVSQYSETFMSPNYFRVAGMSLIQGRLPDSVAWASSPNASPFEVPTEVVVNRRLARQFWPDGRGVIGARLHTGRDGRGRSETYIVVGVVNDVDMPGPRTAMREAEVYRLPWLPASTFLVRAAPSEVRNVAAALRRVTAEVDPGIIVRTVNTGDDFLSDRLAPTRFAMALLTAFAIIALVLSTVGLYGVIAYSVTQRRREIGVRIALGAQSTDVAGLVVGEGLRLVAAGIVIGVVGAAAATRALRGMLYGVGPADPVTFGAIALLLAAIAVLASYVPARRALRVDPLETLREL